LRGRNSRMLQQRDPFGEGDGEVAEVTRGYQIRLPSWLQSQHQNMVHQHPRFQKSRFSGPQGAATVICVQRKSCGPQEKHVIVRLGVICWVLPVNIQTVEAVILEQSNSAVGEALAAGLGRRRSGKVTITLLEHEELLHAAVDIGADIVPGVPIIMLRDSRFGMPWLSCCKVLEAVIRKCRVAVQRPLGLSRERLQKPMAPSVSYSYRVSNNACKSDMNFSYYTRD
ncbi:hypothetical protein KCV07_g335, partial [Aureobasidium melanogenum]